MPTRTNTSAKTINRVSRFCQVVTKNNPLVVLTLQGGV